MEEFSGNNMNASEEIFEHDNEESMLENGYHDNHEEVDEMWFMKESDQHQLLQSTLGRLSEVCQKLDSDVQETFERYRVKITGIEKQDLEKSEKLLHNFETCWLTKCKETENLRVSVKRATHESTRVNDRYHDMQESIGKMRQQFASAIDSSVTEIEELAICNNSLSSMIGDLEDKIRRGDKCYRSNANDNLKTLREIASLTNRPDIDVKSIRACLEKEADRIDRMIVVEDLFAIKEQNASSFAEKSQKMVDAISQGLVETLKNELKECRGIVESQKTRLKELEKEKEDFLLNQIKSKDGGVKEMEELLAYLRKNVLGKDSQSEDVFDSNTLKKQFSEIKQMTSLIGNGLDSTFKNVANKSNESQEYKEKIRELEEDIRNYKEQVESTSQERDFLKTKLEQKEKQHQSSLDELNTINKRLNTVDHERTTLIEEVELLKGGQERSNDYCSSLSSENQQIASKLKCTLEERDDLYTRLHEQIHKTNAGAAELCELESRYEALQHEMRKFKREYQDQTRELSVLTRENEDLKNLSQDKEQERLKMKRLVKSVETGNKDLEDQISTLTSEKQKLNTDANRLKQRNKELAENLNELEVKLKNFEENNSELKSNHSEAESKLSDLRTNLKNLERQSTQDNSLRYKRVKLLSIFEKLAIKLLHNRKQLLETCQLTEFTELPFHVASAQSLEFKKERDIEDNMQQTSQDVDVSFKALMQDMQRRKDETRKYREFVCNVSDRFAEDGFTDDFYDDRDSCYGTDCSEMQISESSSVKRGLSALHTGNTADVRNLPKLLQKLKNKIDERDEYDTRVKKEEQFKQEQEVTQKQNQKLKDLTHKFNYVQRKYQKIKSINFTLKRKISHLEKEAISIRPPAAPTVSDQSKTTAAEIIEALSLKKRPETPVALQAIIESLSKCTKGLDSVKTCVEQSDSQKALEHLATEISVIVQASSDLSKLNCPCDNRTTAQSGDQLVERVEALGRQREYMAEHLTFTNSRLEVLLNCLRGSQERLEENAKQRDNYDHLPMGHPKRVLSRVRNSFHHDKLGMARAVSLLELTKAISVTDLRELGEHEAVDKEQLQSIVLVKEMNENMETVLRQARSNISTDTSKPTFMEEAQRRVEKQEAKDTSSSSEKAEGREKQQSSQSLENANKKLEDLTSYLNKREVELAERDNTIAQLTREYEQLKLKDQSNNETSKDQETRRAQIIEEYKTSKEKLESENEYLQKVVRQLRDELLNIQRSYKSDERSARDYIEELSQAKITLEKSLDAMAKDFDAKIKEVETLKQTIKSMESHQQNNAPVPQYAVPNLPNGAVVTNGVPQYYPYNVQHNGFPAADPSAFNRQPPRFPYQQPNRFPAYPQPIANHPQHLANHPQPIATHAQHLPGMSCPCADCELSESTYPEDTTYHDNIALTDDDIDGSASVDGFESLPDDDQSQTHSSSGSQCTTTRVARTIRTREASESIRSSRRPDRYYDESRTPTRSPKQTSLAPSYPQLPPYYQGYQQNDPPSPMEYPPHHQPIETRDLPENRVRGRRETSGSVVSQRSFPRERNEQSGSERSASRDRSHQRSVSTDRARRSSSRDRLRQQRSTSVERPMSRNQSPPRDPRLLQRRDTLVDDDSRSKRSSQRTSSRLDHDSTSERSSLHRSESRERLSYQLSNYINEASDRSSRGRSRPNSMMINDSFSPERSDGKDQRSRKGSMSSQSSRGSPRAKPRNRQEAEQLSPRSELVSPFLDTAFLAKKKKNKFSLFKK